MSNYDCGARIDHGPNPYVANIARDAALNGNFRMAVWTGNHMQMTLMCIPACSDIGLEVHEDTDQIIRIEKGTAMVKMGCRQTQMDYCWNVCIGDVIFVPAGTWHNIINTGNIPLKVSSIYAPPHHPAGTIQRTKPEE